MNGNGSSDLRGMCSQFVHELWSETRGNLVLPGILWSFTFLLPSVRNLLFPSLTGKSLVFLQDSRVTFLMRPFLNSQSGLTSSCFFTPHPNHTPLLHCTPCCRGFSVSVYTPQTRLCRERNHPILQYLSQYSPAVVSRLGGSG